jgi:hypothetical protein
MRAARLFCSLHTTQKVLLNAICHCRCVMGLILTMKVLATLCFDTIPEKLFVYDIRVTVDDCRILQY